MDKKILMLLTLPLAMSMAAPRSGGMPTAPLSTTPRPFDGTLSVLTYNIHGLPWPVATGRPAQFARIAAHLRDMRSAGRNPHIVAFQEAFTTQAQSIGAAAGYRYVVAGPSADMINAAQPNAQMRRYAQAASWIHGEGIGKYVGGGLEIASDYPILAVHRMAYPAFACAGYDCLANKGAMMVSVQVPGRREPIDIVTTHLNSRGASGMDDGRSLAAYTMQVSYLTDFIHSVHDPRHALIVAGDFNVGESRARRAELLALAHGQWATHGRIDDAYGDVAKAGIILSRDAAYSRSRARDWQFFTAGTSNGFALQQIDVPFGHDAHGGMLSDHVGYTASFRLTSPIARAITNVAQAKQSPSLV